MKDNYGLYYLPFPDNKSVRMYVKEEKNIIYFRLWNTDDEKLWQEHGWVPYEAITKAAEMYNKSNNFNPSQTYDLNIAKALLKNPE